MEDTPPDIEEKYFQMMMELSGSERVIMGSKMFDAARAIVIASLPKDLSREEFKRQLCERIYGAPPEQLVCVVRDGPEEA